ncbi:MAG: transporter [Chryseolinea sp.]
MKKCWVGIVLGLCAVGSATAQDVDYLQNASDPVSMRTRITADIESYFYFDESQFYALRPAYYYGLKNERFLVGMSIPVVHNIFKGDYQGFENTTGMGDLRMSAMYVPFFKETFSGLERVTATLDVSAPTGEYQLGRGAGAWMYRPGVVLTYRPGPALAFYPEVRFLFSTEDVNSQGGSDGSPDPDDSEKDDKLQNLSIALPFVAQLEDWNGWFSIHLMYSHALIEKTDYFFVRSDIGKMLGRRTGASLRISKYIAGQPRLNVLVQANFTWFMR